VGGCSNAVHEPQAHIIIFGYLSAEVSIAWRHRPLSRFPTPAGGHPALRGRANIRRDLAFVTGGGGGASVDARAREMLRLRDQEHLSLREIGERYGISGERVRQIVNRCRHALGEGRVPPVHSSPHQHGAAAVDLTVDPG
jgi:Sigma-70, region 4